MSFILSIITLNILIFLTLSLPEEIKALGKEALLPKIRCIPNGPCYCPEDSLTSRYPDHEDPSCEHYYLCHLGRAFKKKCDVRTAFHPTLAECTPRQRIPESVCTLPITCPLWINRYVEDPDDCTKYYLCFYQRPSLYSCPEGNYFEPDKEKCIHDSMQAEECHNLALIKKGQKLNHSPHPEKTSGALDKAKASRDPTTA